MQRQDLENVLERSHRLDCDPDEALWQAETLTKIEARKSIL